MKIYRKISDFIGVANPVVTIGTFDGVHIGHQKIISGINDIAANIGGESVLLTFSPHPRSIISPDYKMELISTMDERIVLLERAGLNHLIIFPFNKEFSEISPEDYISKLLLDDIGAHTIVVGYDHKFGKDRKGDFSLLQKLTVEGDCQVEKIPEETINDSTVSSTLIRKAIRAGEIEKVEQYLGHPYSFSGLVIDGDKRGKKIGFPTANLKLDDSKLIPDSGVYAANVIVENKHYKAMLNIGFKPTVGPVSKSKSVEVNIFDFSEEIYGKKVEVFIEKKIREEQKFSSIKVLTEQLKKDKITALAILRSKSF